MALSTTLAPRRGAIAVRAELLCRDGAAKRRPVSLSRRVTVIGSKRQCSLRLVSSEVSGCHALILNAGGRLYLRDLNSRTHVHHNGEQVCEAYLENGDLLRIGGFEFQVSADSHAPADPERGAPASRLCVEGRSTAPVPLRGPVFVIGRRQGVDLCIEDDHLSAAHAVVVETQGQWLAADLGSRCGTEVNGVKAGTCKFLPVEPGDRIAVGGIVIRVEAAEVDCQPVVAIAGPVAAAAAGPPLPVKKVEAVSAMAETPNLVALPVAVAAARPASHNPPGVPLVQTPVTPPTPPAPPSFTIGGFAVGQIVSMQNGGAGSDGRVFLSTADAPTLGLAVAPVTLAPNRVPPGPKPTRARVAPAAPAAETEAATLTAAEVPDGPIEPQFAHKGGRIKPAAIQFAQWGPLAAAVLRPQFAGAGGSGEESDLGGAMDTHAGDPGDPLRAAAGRTGRARWSWILGALLAGGGVAAAAALAYSRHWFA